MKNKYKLHFIVSIIFLVTAQFYGCSRTSTIKNISEKPQNITKLVYYTIGTPDNDLKKVNDELNNLLIEKYGIAVDYRKISWKDYGTKLTSLINSGSSFDIAFSAGSNKDSYAENAERGHWLALDEFLKEDGAAIYKSMSKYFWEGSKINGHIYGIPTNKEVAVQEHWIFPKELVDKYKLDINKLTTFEALNDVFKLIKQNEPEYEIMDLDSDSNNFFAIGGYEYLLDKFVPLVIKSNDEKLQVLNVYETNEAKKTLKTLRELYKAGYINKDAAIKENQQIEKDKKVFWFQASGGPYSEASWSNDRGYKVVSVPVTDPVVTTESSRAALMSINSLTKHKEEAFKFLLAVNTDPDVRNMLNYGIKDVHYKLNANNQVVKISSNYSGVQYTQGNWFILNTLAGDPIDKWEQYKEFNKSAIPSKALGFYADISKLSQQIEAVTVVSKKYYPALMTGSVDIEYALPKYNKELKEAGIDEIKEELQRQIDEWLAKN